MNALNRSGPQQRHLTLLPRTDETDRPVPVGTFLPSRSADARSRARAGEQVYECRSVYEDVVEVRFADGEWLLCDHDEVAPG